ncbi:hypothetical protein ROJ8625_03792 [Roseivivax jejudonensis]|uniref:Antitoxin Xre/MbcA/ParS-like toxin-binding domain-containing protein n=1 Tax=Roseivivax jejudonensis TaxID=1529041 RepID=A0A1X7A6U4_9RHOB|nr:hypothetical protein [Roseivivax jejudonensis]SLN72095.1 hypothetical protein ROJ8625_03792 [Roseivivax jejudonensis]
MTAAESETVQAIRELIASRIRTAEAVSAFMYAPHPHLKGRRPHDILACADHFELMELTSCVLSMSKTRSA